MNSNRDPESPPPRSRQADSQDSRQGQTARDPGQGQPAGQGGQYETGAQTAPGPGEGQSSGARQKVELPEHQGVMTDYVPPSGGMRSEVGDFDSDDDEDAGNAPGAGDEPLPGHMGGGLVGG